MQENKQGKSLRWKVPEAESRQKVMKNINMATFKGAYGVKSCRCRCSCSDGY